MKEPINYIKVFVCDYVEDIEKAVNEYAKEHRVTPLSALVSDLGGCVSAAVVFQKRWCSNADPSSVPLY